MVDTILMDLYNAFNCLPHELVKALAKLHVYGDDMRSCELLQDNLSVGFLRVELDSIEAYG